MSTRAAPPATKGSGISRTIPTGGKLALARRAANVDVQNAELTLRRTRNELALKSARITTLCWWPGSESR